MQLSKVTFKSSLISPKFRFVTVDSENRIRIDDRELSKAVQEKVDEIMPKITVENMEEISDLEGYKHDFLATSGFDIEGVDYEEEITSFDGI